jgi:competence protein ComEC
VSWKIGVYFLGAVVGVACILVLDYRRFYGSDWLIVSLALAFVGFVRHSRASLVMVFIAGVSMGLWAGAVQQSELNAYQDVYGTEQSITGRISDDVVVTGGSQNRLTIDQIFINEKSYRGEVWAQMYSGVDMKRGDIVTLRGTVGEGFGVYPASIFSAELVDIARPVRSDVVGTARDSFSQRVTQSIDGPEGLLGVSFLVGQRSLLPSFIQDEFRTLGLVHLVVASGFHLTIVIRFVRRLLSRATKYLATIMSFTVIGVFLLLTGFSTSMTRASLVAGISLLAWYFGRAVHPVVLLLTVAGITAFINPSFVWGDVAWYLSFSAFAGVIILAPLLREYFYGSDKEINALHYILLATTSAQIATFPIIAYTFGQYSPLALVSNLLILPLVPLAMLLTFVTGVVTYVSSFLGGLLGGVTTVVLSYITFVTGWLVESPWAIGTIEMPLISVALSYVVLTLVIVYLQKVTGLKLRKENPIE